MNKLSIVCVYNNEKKLNEILLSSLTKQKDCDYELILVDNTSHKYISACQALNFGCSQAQGKYIVILHQDICFKDPLELKKIYLQCEKHDSFGVIGVAGIVDSQGTLSSITDRIPEQECSRFKVQEPLKCHTVDECLFIIQKSQFNNNQFDEKNNSWHLYAVEYAINMSLNNRPNYIINSSIYHVSNALSLDYTYFKELLRFVKTIKGYKDIEKIYTTCGIWNFRTLMGKTNIRYIYFKQLIKKYIRGFK